MRKKGLCILHFQVLGRFGLSEKKSLLDFLLNIHLFHRPSIPYAVFLVHHTKNRCLRGTNQNIRYLPTYEPLELRIVWIEFQIEFHNMVCIEFWIWFAIIGLIWFSFTIWIYFICRSNQIYSINTSKRVSHEVWIKGETANNLLDGTCFRHTKQTCLYFYPKCFMHLHMQY